MISQKIGSTNILFKALLYYVFFYLKYLFIFIFILCMMLICDFLSGVVFVGGTGGGLFINLHNIVWCVVLRPSASMRIFSLRT